MASRLREIRKAAGLTQDQVASRLGLQGAQRSSYVCQLEKGRIRRPYLDTIVRFLHACGVRIGALSDLLDRVAPLAEDAGLKAIVERAWPDRVLRAEDARERVIRKSDGDAAQFERHVAYPDKGAPPGPEPRRAGAEKLRAYYVQREIVQKDIHNHLAGTGVSVAKFVWCYRLGVKYLAAFRNCPPPKLAATMGEIGIWGQSIGLDPELVSEVRRVVETRWQMSFAPDSQTRGKDAATRGQELELETAFLRLELYEQAYRTALPLLDKQQRLRGEHYCRLATQFYRAWVKVMTGPETARANRLKQEFDALEREAIADGLVPAAVQAVRELCGRRMRV
jgi:transcriptional regulator with XRE-family HTH domain